jgi:C4-dicarboxylate transporter DctQ subunit
LRKMGLVLNKVEYLFLAIAMLSTTLLLFVNVILRYFFNSAIFWTEEVLRYLIVWITFVGAATCITKGSHISLDTILVFLPENQRKILRLGVNMVGVFFSVLILWYSLQLTLAVKATNQLSATIGGFPMYIVYSCMPLGSLLAACRFAQNAFKGIHGADSTTAGQGGEE